MNEEGTGITLSRSDGVLTVSLNRPAVGNALSPPMIQELTDVFISLKIDRSVHALILAGEGAHFCSGGDVREFQSLISLSVSDRRAAMTRIMARANAMIAAFAAIPVPVVTVCRGVTAGGGLSFVLAADLVLADSTARFLFSHQRMALPPDAGISLLLPALVGDRRARELVLTAASVDAEAALLLGLVSRISGLDRLSVDATAAAAQLARGSDGATRAAKELMVGERGEKLRVSLEVEQAAIVDAVGTLDFEEAVKAFFDRRQPLFSKQIYSGDTYTASPSSVTA